MSTPEKKAFVLLADQNVYVDLSCISHVAFVMDGEKRCEIWSQNGRDYWITSDPLAIAVVHKYVEGNKAEL